VRKFDSFNFYDNYHVVSSDLFLWLNSFFPYNLDYITYDLSDHNHNFYSRYGHTTPKLMYKTGGRFYDFDGIDDFFLNEFSKFQSLLCTIGCWISLRDITSLNYLCCLGGLCLFFESEKFHISYQNRQYIAPLPIDLNTWFFLSIRVKDGQFNLFIDNSFVEIKQVSSELDHLNSSNGYLGSYIDGIFPFKGSISSFFYMNTACTTSDLNKIYLKDRCLYI